MTDISRVTARDDETTRQNAINHMQTLYNINQRWNLPGITDFIRKKQKELLGW
ncbi:MAG: hypothetical protein R6U29_04160 [Desulfosudaceae bacterium]